MPKCETCEVKVTIKEKRIQCSACEKWYHIKCQNVDEAKYNFFIQPGNKDVHWLCTTCNSQSAKIFMHFAQMTQKVEKLEENFKEVKEELVCIKTQINELIQASKENEKKLNDDTKLNEDVVATVERKINLQVKEVQEEMKEKLEIERRRSNIVLFGLKESSKEQQRENDINMVKKILSEGLNLDPERHVEEVFRIGRYDSKKTRPIRVKIKTLEGRAEILKRSKMLKEKEEHSEVYIAMDLTRKQQSKDRELRDKLKEIKDGGETECKIRNGKIIKNGAGNKEIVLFPIREEQV